MLQYATVVSGGNIQSLVAAIRIEDHDLVSPFDGLQTRAKGTFIIECGDTY